MPMIACPDCGHPNDAAHEFCESCGKSIPRESSEPEATMLSSSPEFSRDEESPPTISIRKVYRAPNTVRLPRRPHLVLTYSSGEMITLKGKDEYFVGRKNPADEWYPDVDITPHGGERKGVSRRHAQLEIVTGNVYLLDLGSTNGTFVDDEEVHPGKKHQLTSGCVLRFGEAKIVFEIVER